MVDNMFRNYNINITARLHTDPIAAFAAVDVNGTYLLSIESNQALSLSSLTRTHARTHARTWSSSGPSGIGSARG